MERQNNEEIRIPLHEADFLDSVEFFDSVERGRFQKVELVWPKKILSGHIGYLIRGVPTAEPAFYATISARKDEDRLKQILERYSSRESAPSI